MTDNSFSTKRRLDLIAALLEYKSLDSEEMQSLKRFHEFLTDTSAPFARSNPIGHVTVSAIIANKTTGKFLFVYHEKLNKWLQPGGHVEDTDVDLVGAAKREVKEETGLVIEPSPLGFDILDIDVHTILARYNEPQHSHFDVRYFFLANDNGTDSLPISSMRSTYFSHQELEYMHLDSAAIRAVMKASKIIHSKQVKTI